MVLCGDKCWTGGVPIQVSPVLMLDANRTSGCCRNQDFWIINTKNLLVFVQFTLGWKIFPCFSNLWAFLFFSISLVGSLIFCGSLVDWEASSHAEIVDPPRRYMNMSNSIDWTIRSTEYTSAPDWFCSSHASFVLIIIISPNEDFWFQFGSSSALSVVSSTLRDLWIQQASAQYAWPHFHWMAASVFSDWTETFFFYLQYHKFSSPKSKWSFWRPPSWLDFGLYVCGPPLSHSCDGDAGDTVTVRDLLLLGHTERARRKEDEVNYYQTGITLLFSNRYVLKKIRSMDQPPNDDDQKCGGPRSLPASPSYQQHVVCYMYYQRVIGWERGRRRCNLVSPRQKIWY